MLKCLLIKDYAIIDRVEVEFENGLNIITGETGAGKSIIIGAFGLLLGEPFSVDFIRKGAKKTVIEGQFYIKEKEILKEFLKNIEIPDLNDEVIIRREINQRGKSRVFINDSPVKLQVIKEFGDMLVDLHGQHEHQSLMKSDFYYLLLDQYGKIGELAHRIKNLFFELKRLEAEKRKIFRDFKEYREKRDILEFQLNEIRMVNPIVGEDEKMEREINITENFEKIWELANQNFQILDGESDSVGEKLNMVLNYLNELISIDKSFEEVRKYIES